MTQLILFNVFNGLIVGAFYALMALGLSLILNLSGVINFAHGGFLALGAYLAYTLMPYIGFWGALLVAPVLTALVGLIVERVADPPALRPRSALQPAAHLRPRLHLRGRARASSGVPQSLPYPVPAMAQHAAQQRVLLPDRLSPLHGAAGRRAAVLGAVPDPRYTRLGMRIRAGTLDLDTVSVLGVNVRLLRNLNFGLGIYLAGLAGVLAAGMLGLQPTIGTLADHAELRRHHRRRARQPAGHAAGRPADRRRLGRRHRLLPSASEAVIYVMMGLVLLIRPRGLLGEEGRLQ